MKEQSLLLQLVGDAPIFRVIDFLIDNKGIDFTKKDLYEGANISKASLFKHWKELEKFGLVQTTRRFGNTQLFTLNTTNPLVKKILELESALIRQSLQQESRKKVLIAQREVATA